MGAALNTRRPPRGDRAWDDEPAPSWRVPAVDGFEAVLAEQRARLLAAGRAALSDFAAGLARDAEEEGAPARLRPGG